MDSNSPIARDFLQKWQSLVNLMAKSLTMPAGFIVRYIAEGYEVLIASDNPDNPYVAGNIISADTNIFCKEVVKTCKMLAVFEATQLSQWATNPEVKDDHFNTYVGFPLLYPNGSVFGTLCVMDLDRHPLQQAQFELMQHLKSVVEHDLQIHERLDSITDLSLKDDLTGLYNRRGFNIISQKQFHLGQRSHKKFGLIIADIDSLKHINDHYGHSEGDQAILKMSQSLSVACRQSDLVARIGGDEFLIAMHLDNDNEIEAIVERAEMYLVQNPLHWGSISFSWGSHIEEFKSMTSFELSHFLLHADKALYLRKTMRH